MKKFLLILLVSIIEWVNTAFAQRITGSVVNAQGEPLEYATVALVSRADSSVVGGCLTDARGTFRLDSINAAGNIRQLFVRVSSMGYVTKDAGLPLCGAITLEREAKELGGITVTAARKYVKLNATGLTVEMDGNPLSKLPSAKDAIRMMPMIDVTSQDLSVPGKGAPEIYINSRKARGVNELAQLSPENIKSVDIITEPGVKYGADVNAVIIIHTKAHDAGLSGVFTGNGTLAKAASGMASADLYYTLASGLYFFAGGAVSDDGSKTTQKYVENFNDGLYRTSTDGTYKTRGKSMKVVAGGSYDFDKDNSVGVRYEYSRMPSNNYRANCDILTNVDGADDHITSTNEIGMQSMQHYVNAYAVVKFGTKKNWELTTDGDFLYGTNDNGQNTSEFSQTLNNVMSTDNSFNYHFGAVKANFTATFGKFTLDFGGEYSHTASRTHFLSMFGGTSSFTEYHTKQNLAGGYAAVNFSPDNHWLFMAGLRTEFANTDYYNNGRHMDMQSRSYDDWLPKFMASYTNGALRVALSYNSQVARPKYSMLNNNYTYLTHTSWSVGNPYLRSNTPFNIDLDVSWKQTLLKVLFIRSRHNIMPVYTYQPEYKVNVERNINLPDYNVFNIILSHSMDIGFWHPLLQGDIAFSHLKYGTPEQVYDKPIGKVTLQNSFDLPWGIYAYLTGWWMSKGHNSLYYVEGNSCVSAIINKSVGSWSFTLVANDIFGTQRAKLLTSTNGVSVEENQKGAFRFVQLSVAYSFNGKKTKKYKGKGTGSSELNRF